MNIQSHKIKISDIGASLNKLDPLQDYEAVIELAMLIAAHYLNAAFHKEGAIPINKDIRHNRLASFLRDNKILARQEDIRIAIEGIEALRPSHVYGKGKDKTSGKRALGYLATIRAACEGML